jgi:hypothetical protein
MATFKIWQGATRPSINLTFYEQKTKTQNQTFDLSDLDNAKIIWAGDDGVVQERFMNFIDLPNGILQYDWVPEDTEESIYADLWFLLEFNDDTKLIFTSVVGKKDKLHIMATTDPVCDI